MPLYLLLAAGSLLLALALIHAALALRDLRKPSFFAPADSHTLRQMRSASLRLSPRTTLWRAWLGFNLSHALGLAVSGVVLIAIALYDFSLFSRSSVLQLLSLAVIAAYLALSLRFWFRVPTAILATSLALVALSILV